MVAFTASSVLTAAALNTAFNAYTVNAQTGTTYTFVLTDHGGLVTASNASSSTYTVPPNASVAFAIGDRIGILNIGAGIVTLNPGSGVTINGSSLNISQYGGGTLVKTATNTWYFVAGGSPKASVSSTTGSPTTGANGTKTYYKFTGSGSVTLTGGTFDALILGGGGGGNLGGGGAGQLLYITNAYLAGGTYTVTVGAGGAAGTIGGLSLIGTGLIAIGGGAGAANAVTGGIGGNGGGGGGSGVGGASASGGFAGGNGLAATLSHGGGGGTSAVGAAGATNVGGNGGAGTSNSITGSAVTYGGGGGGGTNAGTIGTGGTGGGGNGSTTTGVAGTANTGGGGGGGPSAGGIGGSGVVILLIG